MTRAEPPSPAETGDSVRRDWSDDEERALRLWISLARCYSTFAKAIAVKVQEYDLTTPQFGVLEALFHLGPLSLGELADKLLVTGGNVTYVMDRLEEQGLVFRERSPKDRRVIQAKLTAENGTARRWAASKLKPDEIIDEMFLSTVSRFPRPKERALFREVFTTTERREAVADCLWTLLNSKQFLYNH